MWACFQASEPQIPLEVSSSSAVTSKMPSGAWTRDTSYKEHTKSYICSRKYFLKGRLALFPNPLYPHVHHGTQALLPQHSSLQGFQRHSMELLQLWQGQKTKGVPGRQGAASKIPQGMAEGEAHAHLGSWLWCLQAENSK